MNEKIVLIEETIKEKNFKSKNKKKEISNENKENIDYININNDESSDFSFKSEVRPRLAVSHRLSKN
jgi:hypothetical protein